VHHTYQGAAAPSPRDVGPDEARSPFVERSTDNIHRVTPPTPSRVVRPRDVNLYCDILPRADRRERPFHEHRSLTFDDGRLRLPVAFDLDGCFGLNPVRGFGLRAPRQPGRGVLANPSTTSAT